VRTGFSCRLYNTEEVQSKFDEDAYGRKQLNLVIDREKCIDKYDVHQYNFVMNLTAQNHSEMIPDDAVFAVNRWSNIDRFFVTYSKACSRYLWTWGRFTFSKEANRTSITAVALGCNDTVETVDVRTTFLGTDLRIDPRRPPVPDEGTARIWPLNANFSLRASLYGDTQLGKLVRAADGTYIDDFFTMLTTSRYAIPVSYLSNVASTDATAAVIAAIRLQTGIMRAQEMSFRWRDPAGNCSDVNATYAATATLEGGTRRLMQDATTTRVLQALLAGAVVLSLVGWHGAGRARGVLPRSPTAVASMAALVMGGNLLDVIPEGRSESHSDKMWQTLRKEALFWMGWREAEHEVKGNVRRLGERRFGIWVLRKDGTLWHVQKSA
jgi:hypothetical protein